MTVRDESFDRVFESTGHTVGKLFYATPCFRDRGRGGMRMSSGSPYFAKCTKCGVLLMASSHHNGSELRKFVWIAKWNKVNKDFDKLTTPTLMWNVQRGYNFFEDYECSYAKRVAKAVSLT